MNFHRDLLMNLVHIHFRAYVDRASYWFQFSALSGNPQFITTIQLTRFQF